jgi:hypothetical protein
MFTQIRERDGAGQLVDLRKPGPSVQLFEQTADHQVKYGADADDPATLPAHEFFTLFREETREEIEGGGARRGRGKNEAAPAG